VACLERLSAFPVPEAAIRRALLTAEWPARLQRLRTGPLIGALPPGWVLCLDGEHKPYACKALAAFLHVSRARPLHLIAGMLYPQDNAGFLRPLAPLIERARTVAIHGTAAALDPQALAEIARSVGMQAAAAPDIATAVAELTATAEPAGRI